MIVHVKIDPNTKMIVLHGGELSTRKAVDDLIYTLTQIADAVWLEKPALKADAVPKKNHKADAPISEVVRPTLICRHKSEDAGKEAS